MDDAVYYPWFKSLDPDGSGELAFDEFIALFGKDIAGEAEDPSAGGLGGTIMDANANYKAPATKAYKQRGQTCEEAEIILKRKMQDQFAQCSKAFRSFDYDHSGAVEKSEFRGLLERFCIYMEEREFERLFARFDPDGSGEIGYDEFIKYVGAAMSAKETGGVGIVLQAL